MTCLHNKSVVTCPENNQISKFAFSGVWIGLATPPYLWQKLNYRHICFEEIKPDRVAVLKLERVRSHCGKKTLLTPGGCAHLHLHKKALTHCCTLHTAHCTLHTAHCTLHTWHTPVRCSCTQWSKQKSFLKIFQVFWKTEKKKDSWSISFHQNMLFWFQWFYF